MQSLRDRKKHESWRSIRSAALELFEARGFEAVSIDDIARAADVSRATFFNYFVSKEAVVFDADPEDRDYLLRLMDARPVTEDLWESLQAILMQNLSRYADRAALQKKLKAASPKLARSSRDMTTAFNLELRDWAFSRASGDSAARVALQVNIAVVVVSTAYDQWDADSPFSQLIDLAAELFATSAGFAYTH